MSKKEQKVKTVNRDNRRNKGGLAYGKKKKQSIFCNIG